MELKLSETQRQQLKRDFENAPDIRKKEVVNLFNTCSEAEKLCLEYLYAYMPAADLVSYSPAYFLNNIKLAFSIQKKVSWAEEYSTEIFLNFVLPMRVNNEDLTGYRELFFDEIFPRIQGMTLRQAIIEVNYWCYEKATYKSTDFRTISPLGAIRNGYGRCGEESVLLVAALRSVGIPARQNYSPRWAHCDDNHAWVEIYASGEWVFTGACEPEPVLNHAWFIQPASRGMLVQARVFSHLVSGEEITAQSPIMSLVNVTDHYAKTKTLHIKVQDKKGNPVAGAAVHPQVLNFAQMYPLAELVTGSDGTVCFKTGYGDLFLLAFKNGSMGEIHVDAAAKEAVVQLGVSPFVSQPVSEISMIAPSGAGAPVAPAPPPEDSAAKIHAQRMEQCDGIRKKYEQSFYSLEAAKTLCKQYDESYYEQAAECLVLSNGNHEEIIKFLQMEQYPFQYKTKLLASLRKKDLSDITCEVLQDHIDHALEFANQVEEEIFTGYLLCPHVKFEKIEAYRGFIKGYFSAEQRGRFLQNPKEIYRYLAQNIQDCGARDYATLYASPKGLLQYQYGSAQSRDNAFVMIARTFGIPARLNPADKTLEYYKQGGWNRIVSTEKESTPKLDSLLLLAKQQDDAELLYKKNFTIAKLLENGSFQTLDFDDISFTNGQAQYPVQSGVYRVTTSNRMQDGSCLVNLYTVEIGIKESKTVAVGLQKPTQIERHGVTLPDMLAKTASGENLDVLKKFSGASCVLMQIEVGKEPTEHLLNEILEQPEQFRICAGKLLFLTSDPGSETYPPLVQVMEKTGIQLASWDKDKQQVDELFELLQVPHRERPLVLFVNPRGECVFSIAGYNVGTGEQILKYLLA